MKEYYSFLLKRFRVEKEDSFGIIKHLAGEGSLVVDIGANIGIFTKMLSSLVGDKGMVYSIEPVPIIYNVLYSNIKRLSLRNVEAINCALWDSEGDAFMAIPDSGFGIKDYYRANILDDSRCSKHSSNKLMVHRKTLDSLLTDNPVVSFIKCDTEGSERRCVLGALNIIEKMRPAWMIEVTGSDPYKDTGNNIFDLMFGYGYRAYHLREGRLKETDSSELCINNRDIFFLTPSHRTLLEKQGIIF